MSKFLTILLAVLLSWPLFAQDKDEEFEGRPNAEHQKSSWFKLMNSKDPNYFEVTKAFEVYFKENEFENSTEIHQYKGWLNKIGTNFDASGKILPFHPLPEDQEIMTKAKSSLKSAMASSWTQLGPFMKDTALLGNGGCRVQGVCRSLTIDPNNSNKIFATVESSIWRTLDNGINWTCVSKNINATNFRCVAVAKTNSNIVYAGTNGGVFKSTDGGTTWTVCPGLNWTSTLDGTPVAMVVSPTDANVAIFGNEDNWGNFKGIWRTADGGATWAKISTRVCHDVKFHPTNGSIVYMTTQTSINSKNWAELWRSTDAGATWGNITSGYPTQTGSKWLSHTFIGVCGGAVDVVYACVGGGNDANGVNGFYGLYKSTNAGVSFTRIFGDECASAYTESKPNILGIDFGNNWTVNGLYQGLWDNVFSVSATDPNYLIAGACYAAKSTNGGTSWTKVIGNSNGFFHPDFQSCVMSGNKTFLGTDGGIHFSTDKCANLYDRSWQIGAQQTWGFDQGWKSDIMMMGSYHGPIEVRDDAIYNGWFSYGGADASQALVNKGEDRYLYGWPWTATKYKRATSRTNPDPISGDLGTGMLEYVHPIDVWNHTYWGTFYMMSGNTELKKTTDNASSWTTVKTFAGNIFRLGTCYYDVNRLYVIENWNKIWKSTDGGANWTDVTPGGTLTQSKSFSNITVGSDPNVVWVSMGGNQNVVKVLKSTDGGSSWTNYSGTTITSGEIHTIVAQLGTNGGVYIGTEQGVWYRNNTMADWQLYNANLPWNLKAWFLRINYAKKKIRLGSSGFGIWEADLYEPSTTLAHPMVEKSTFHANTAIQFVDHSVCLANATYAWSFPGGSPSTSTAEKPVVTYTSAGNYNVSLTVTDANGSSSKTISNMVTVDNLLGNVALNKPVTVSSSEASNVSGGNAVDGEASTRWASILASDPQWISIDLQNTYNINRVFLNWEYARSKDFKIEVSTNGTTWTAIKTVTGNTSFTNDLTGLSGTGRYIRMYGTARATEYGYSLWEFEVYGTLASSNSNIALNKPVTVSSTESAGYEGSKAVDGDLYTRWSSSFSDPQWIMVDLQNTYSINRVVLKWENAYGKDFKIQTSANGTTWTAIKTVTGNTSLTNDYTGLSGTGRYIRMKGTARGTTNGYSLYEFEVYGNLAPSMVLLSNPYIKNDKEISIYPNPAQTYVNINLEGTFENSQTIKLYLIDYKGTVVISKEINNQNQFRLELGEVEKNQIYLLKLVGDRDEQLYKKLVLIQ